MNRCFLYLRLHYILATCQHHINYQNRGGRLSTESTPKFRIYALAGASSSMSSVLCRRGQFLPYGQLDSFSNTPLILLCILFSSLSTLLGNACVRRSILCLSTRMRKELTKRSQTSNNDSCGMLELPLYRRTSNLHTVCGL